MHEWIKLLLFSRLIFPAWLQEKSRLSAVCEEGNTEMFATSRSSHLLALVLECCCLSCSLYKEISSCGQQFISLLFCQLMACRKRKPVIVWGLPSTKNTRTFETEAKGVKISLESFRKIWKLFSLENRRISGEESETRYTSAERDHVYHASRSAPLIRLFRRLKTVESTWPKIPGILGEKSNGTEILKKKVSKIWVYLKGLSTFSEISENAAPFQVQTGSFGRTESTPC